MDDLANKAGTVVTESGMALGSPKTVIRDTTE